MPDAVVDLIARAATATGVSFDDARVADPMIFATAGITWGDGA